jgi:predicted deacetylase
LVVSIHDVSPATAEQTRRWCADTDTLGIPVSLLVIPGPWRGQTLAEAPDYAAELRERVSAHGDEIVLHGFTHTAGSSGPALRRLLGRAVARGAAEFAALDEAHATELLTAGASVLRSLGLTAQGFTPPGWLASPGALRALTATGFSYVTTHRGLRRLPSRSLTAGFALSHRPVGGVSEWIGATLLSTTATNTARRGGLVRIALHPDDLSRPRLRSVTLRAISAALAAGATAHTYGELAATVAA